MKQLFESELPLTEHENGTKERLLDAAEQLFASQGPSATSIRQVTTAARANLAAVHYHFGSKLDLLRAVMGRHVAPVNADRLGRLERRPQLDLNTNSAAILVADAVQINISTEARRIHDVPRLNERS